MSRLIVGPFNRVEGDLEVHLQLQDQRVVGAEVKAPMYRGFEQILQGKHPEDALVYVPRICGICSVSQSVASARALADLCGVRPPPNGQAVTDLMLATENLADHLSHFYLFFMPDFGREVYAGQPWHAQVRQAFDPQQGTSVRQALAARQRWMVLLGHLAGKWPHTQSIQPGGSAKPIDAMERSQLLMRITEFRQFLEQQLFGAPLEAVTSCPDLDTLKHLVAGTGSDLDRFLGIAEALQLHRLGPGPGRLMSYGTYAPLQAAGVWHNDQLHPLDTRDITEDCSHAWLADGPGPLHPAQGHTLPDADKPGAYTWNKAPRLQGRVMETGALARQVMSGQTLARQLVAQAGSQVLSRVLGRLLELAVVVPQMTRWVRELRPGEPYCSVHELPDAGCGVGLTEAARGSLGHWLEVDKGRITRYQIIAPTSWNFSPRDAQGQAGALEAALLGAPVQPGEKTPVAVQHIVRSFDPCMVCTVH